MEKTPDNYIYVLCDKFTDHNDDGDDSLEPYSYRGTTTTTWTFRGLSKEAPRHGYYADSVLCDFAPVVGEVLHAVVVVYSTGDSFGHDENASCEAVAVFRDAEKAKALRDAIDTGAAFYITETGMSVNFYKPWDGYFESLSYVEIVSGVLQI